MIEVLEHVGAKLYYLTRKVTMDDIKIEVRRAEKHDDDEYVPQHVSAYVTLAIANPKLLEHSELIRNNDFHGYGDSIGFTATMVSRKIEFRGCRDKLKKHNETVDNVNSDLDVKIEIGYERALSNLNKALEDRLSHENVNAIDRIQNIYGNVSSFDFTTDDEPELVKEVAALQKKINELQKCQENLNELIRLNRIECVKTMADKELDPRIAEMVKEEISKENTYKTISFRLRH